MPTPWIRACLIASAGILLFATARGADWPQWRGPGGQGIAEAKGLPTEWNDQTNLLWRIALPGPGSSSPIALGDRLYLTCYSGYGVGGAGENIDALRRHLVCVDQKSGKILWDEKIPPRAPEQKTVRDHGYTPQTPATDGKAIYVFFDKCGLFKFDLNGQKIWQADVGDGTHGWGGGPSPVLCGNLVIVNASVESKSLIGIDKASGKEAWRAPGMDQAWNTPHLVSVGEKEELVVSVKGLVLAFDPASGQELWRCRGIQDYICPSIVSADGIVYAIGGRKSRALAIRAGGRGDVSTTHLLWEAEVGANVSSPVVHAGHLYWASDRNQHAYCLSLKDGAILYDEAISGQPYASMLAADEKLFVVTRHKGVLVLPAEPTFKILASNQLEDKTQFNASPIVANGNLILRSDSSLYCIGIQR